MIVVIKQAIIAISGVRTILLSIQQLRMRCIGIIIIFMFILA